MKSSNRTLKISKSSFAAFACGLILFAPLHAQNRNATPAATQSSPAQTSPTAPRPVNFDLSDYGVTLAPDARLIVVMAALDAAGFDPTPSGSSPSNFRTEVRQAYGNVDETLRNRLISFVKSQQSRTANAANKTNATTQLAQQAAPYVSLAFALGNAPTFEIPARTEDLPADVLDVLDFAPLARDFYNRSGLAAKLPELLRLAQKEADGIRPAAVNTIRTGVAYLRTRPQIIYNERVPVRTTNAKSSNKKTAPTFTLRERERRFHIVPDSLGVPGTINFRIIGDDYFVLLAPGASPAAPDVRRAYLQFLIDPLINRFGTQIALRRADIKTLLDAQKQSSPQQSSSQQASAEQSSSTQITTSNTEIFPAVTRSLIAAADARIDEVTRLAALRETSDARLRAAKTDAERLAITRDNTAARAAITDRTALALSEAYQRGAILSFYFAEQLRGVEESGFDVVNFLPDMFASFTPTRELTRLAENKIARDRAIETRRVAQATQTEDAVPADPRLRLRNERNEQLAVRLAGVQRLLQANDYTEAEKQLRSLSDEYQADSRILFALGQAASASARDAIDEAVRDERLNRALSHYRLSIETARTSGDEDTTTNRALLSRAYVSIARILEFQDKTAEARAAYDDAIKIGEVAGGSYTEALAGKQNLPPQ